MISSVCLSFLQNSCVSRDTSDYSQHLVVGSTRRYSAGGVVTLLVCCQTPFYSDAQGESLKWIPQPVVNVFP